MADVNLTKDEVSDLNSHIARKVECELKFEHARLALMDATRILDNEINRLQFRRTTAGGK